MRKGLRLGIICNLAIAACTLAWAQQPAQDKSTRSSPPATTECSIKGKKVTISYSQPSMKGRKIVGELVPYGKVWRTGANEATTLTTAIDLDIGGAKVPAGTYTLYTLPAPDNWKLIINKQTGQWGTVYNQDQDLARVDMKKEEIVVPVETFTMSLDQDDNSSADLVLEWEKTRLKVLVKAATPAIDDRVRQ
ncbi:MAG TPA: DUF2911 domain-containing protein [Terriglobales bacterium]